MSDPTGGHFFPTPPPPPDPKIALEWTQWLGQLRGVLIMLGGFGLGGTWLKKFTSLTDAELSGYVAAIVTVVGLAAWLGPAAWSWIEKAQTAWAVKKALRLAEVSAAVASAARGVPVTVLVTPPGQENVAVLVPFMEKIAAEAVSPPPIPPEPEWVAKGWPSPDGPKP